MSRPQKKWVKKATVIEAPVYEPSPIRTSHRGKSPLKLECRKLSAPACDRNPDCEYSERNRICEPLGRSSDEKMNYEQYIYDSKRRWRSGVESYLDALEHKEVDLVDVVKNIKIFSTAEKGSASDSVIMAGSIMPTALDVAHSKGGRNVIIKATFPAYSPLRNSLEVETAVYKNIITNLVNNMHTPGVMTYLGSFTHSIDSLSKDTKNAFKDATKTINKYSTDYDKTANPTLLFLERSDGTQLKDWLSPSRSERDILSICFQVMYTLVCFNNINMVHNDLHFGNIFIEEFDRPVTRYFNKGGGEYVELTTKYDVKIYDFDRASVRAYPGIPRNILLDGNLCKDYGTCNSVNPKYDSFTFISIFDLFQDYYPGNIAPDIKTNITQKWMLKIIDKKWYSDILDKANVKDKAVYQVLNGIPTDSQFKSTKDILTALVSANWDDAPFRVVKGDTSMLPKELVYTPPERKAILTTIWTPTSTRANKSLSAHFIEILKINGPPNEYRTMLDFWAIELEKSGYKFLNNANKLAAELVSKKPEVRTVPSWYLLACSLLCIPMFHKMSQPSELALSVGGTKLLDAVVQDVWNVFGNVLPIEMPMEI